MVIEKYYIGQNTIGSMQLQYYMLKKQDSYGVEIVENYADKMVSEQTFFCEEEEPAHALAKALQKGQVTICTLTEIVDDFVGL